MRLTRVLGVGIGVTALVLASACGSAGSSDPSKPLVDRVGSSKRLTIGVKIDQPGLSERRLDGKFAGFDIEVAKYIARELGVNENDITWREARSGDRESLIKSGQVDMVVASYSITDKRKNDVDFAGPYFLAGQDLLVRSDNKDISGPDTLNGKRVCTVTGSTSVENIQKKGSKEAAPVTYGKYSDCVTALLTGNTDAVTTDDVILAGYAAQNPELVKVVGKRFSEEKYGIGIRKGDTNSRNKISDIVDKMIKDGSWRSALDKTVGLSGYKIPDPPNITEKS